MDNYIMDYSTPLAIIESGARAFRVGIQKSDCPISSRTGANKIEWWRRGWEAESLKTCKGDNCAAVRGVGHSEECEREHDKIAKEALKSPCPRCGKLFLYPAFSRSMAGSLSYCSDKCMDGKL